jgi:hypothetical protein
MITVSCKDLQQVKADPALYAANLISKGNEQQGQHGMFAQWKTIARELHVKELSISDALNKLSLLYSMWNINPRNAVRSDFFHEALVQYEKLFNKKGWTLLEGNHRMKWPLHQQVTLGGYTPWVASKGESYFSYLFTEKSFDWKEELRFPLIQHYLATKILDCDMKDLQIGVYSLADHSFNLKNFSPREIALARNETRRIFTRFNNEYIKRKSATS